MHEFKMVAFHNAASDRFFSGIKAPFGTETTEIGRIGRPLGSQCFHVFTYPESMLSMIDCGLLWRYLQKK